ncbi:SbcC/MukB-like Walker B domain-containing protein [Streptomyces sp. NPDC057445]|uniref:SbcC/MukB-like Walker B domain-containing protein n=1 Tax=Streptomyces sp. NPDC057445 TaxID=3346136 RepID=UPI0036ACB7D6
MSDLTITLTPSTDQNPAPAPAAEGRHQRRFTLHAVGVSNVWAYAHADFQIISGRLVLRGSNGTGKTTLLEALYPYLLDLDARRLNAAKARGTTLAVLMEHGLQGTRRIGYLWVTFAAPTPPHQSEPGLITYGVRLEFSRHADVQVTVTPWRIPGRPEGTLTLHEAGGAAVTADDFTQDVQQVDGEIFTSPDDYVDDLATRIYGATAGQLRDIAKLTRNIRNPWNMTVATPKDAANALRENLPEVSQDVLEVTGKALTAADETRRRCERDRQTADHMEAFATAWSGYARDTVHKALHSATALRRQAQALEAEAEAYGQEQTDAARELAEVERELSEIEGQQAHNDARIKVLENSDAIADALDLERFRQHCDQLNRQAASAWTVLESQAGAQAERSQHLHEDAEDLARDIDAILAAARQSDPQLNLAQRPVRLHAQPQTVLELADRVIDPGPAVTVRADASETASLSKEIRDSATRLETQAHRAACQLRAHEPVAAAEQDSQNAHIAAEAAAAAAHAAHARLQEATHRANTAAQASLDTISAWPAQVLTSLQLASTATPFPDAVTAWAEQHTGNEPSHVLAAAQKLERESRTLLDRAAERVLQRAERHRRAAAALETQADDKDAEARHWSGGQLPPLPRPSWAPSVPDDHVLGAALRWNDDAPPPGPDRDRLEAALTTSGLLGATLTPSTLHAPGSWTATVRGPQAVHSLNRVLEPLPEHPHAGTVTALLARIALLPSADQTANCPLTIGQDGSWSAGPLTGRHPGADDPTMLPSAAHVGTDARRAAAHRLAEQARAEARTLRTDADRHRRAEYHLNFRAQKLKDASSTFPTLDDLDHHETARVQAATTDTRAREEARTYEHTAYAASERFELLQRRWNSETRTQGLPADPLQLTHLTEENARRTAHLRTTADRLTHLSQSVERLATRSASPTESLDPAFEQARNLYLEHQHAAAELHQRQQHVPDDVAELQQRLGAAQDEHERLTTRHKRATARQKAAQKQSIDSTARREELSRRLQAEAPAAEAAMTRLRTLIAAPGIRSDTTDGDNNDHILTIAADYTESGPTTTLQEVHARADTLRAHLASEPIHGWQLSIHTGDQHDQHDLHYQLLRDATAYAPPEAAQHAAALRDRAEQELADADATALDKFVVGRIPAALGAAWARLMDWCRLVNQRMALATASSGVGVRVDIALERSLSPGLRTIHRLACHTSDADRTPDDQERICAELLAQLRTSTDGTAPDAAENRAARLRSIVDISNWVTIRYEITRPGEDPTTWGSGTHLSGGERRLVVLAPMLAALAAAHDSLATTAPRITALDEIPAEVDLTGRDALARYLSHLDLDLICTSHAWDGSPDAWDGVDAYNLHKTSNGTVIARPMHLYNDRLEELLNATLGEGPWHAC